MNMSHRLMLVIIAIRHDYTRCRIMCYNAARRAARAAGRAAATPCQSLIIIADEHARFMVGRNDDISGTEPLRYEIAAFERHYSDTIRCFTPPPAMMLRHTLTITITRLRAIELAHWLPRF